MIGVHAAVNHSNPAERVSAQEGLELYTINAARIAFQEADTEDHWRRASWAISLC